MHGNITRSMVDQDLERDLAELLHIARWQGLRLHQFKLELNAPGDRFRNETRNALLEVVDGLLPGIDVLVEELTRASAETPLETIRDRLRSLQGIVASVCASLDWQSPSYKHAMISQAGVQAGHIQGTVNDYKRDGHLDARSYEHAFIRAYVDHPLLTPVHAYTCSSGMAAFTTIVHALQKLGALSGPIVLGENSYFENKIVLNDLFADEIVEVDELDTQAVLDAVRREKPRAIFLDSWCNTETLAILDLATILPTLARECQHETYLVLDNSGLASSVQPVKLLPPGNRHLKLIVFESLNKHHQFGMDRVTGGIIWTPGFDGHGLYAAREHLGTIMSDASVLALPAPNREILSGRLARLERNALMMANALQDHLKQKTLAPFSRVVYPGRGASLVLAFKPSVPRVPFAQAFIAAAIAEAKHRRVDLLAGTSFGLNTTRVYLTALHAHGNAKPFLRVSPGIESATQTQILIEIFKAAIDRVALP